MGTRGLRNGAILSFVVSMALLLVGGFFAKDRVPPIPERVVQDGTQLSGRDAILRGQSVYQRYGLMDHGSVWGHGSLRGMDFSAGTLHRVGQHMREFAAGGEGPQTGAYESLSPGRRLEIDAGVIEEIRTNRYDAASGTLTLTPAQADAFARIRAYWEQVFAQGDGRYGFLPNTVPSAAERRDLADFFFWAAWAAGTERPDLPYTYTNNWPSDQSVGNRAPTNAFVWSIASILALFAVLGTVVYVVHRYRFFYGEARAVEAARQILASPLTPSQRASAKFFLVAGLLFVVQIMNGELLAHYTVHPGSFYIPFIGDVYPYSWAKSWHLQLAILWIAVSWMGTAIYLAPLVGRSEPRGQRALVIFYLFSAIFVVLFFGFGLLYGRGTHLTIADYWRWFVVHIWVESIFEFFGVAVISLFLVTLGLVQARAALRVAYLTAILVFVSGIPGTAHHYFWYGGSSFWLPIGGVFSSLEPIPLILLVVRAWMEYRSIRAEGREFPYRWPLYFLTASSVWNFLGAAVFGFMINLPIINYYEHATYLTANHAHAALFGVYGMLAIGLILFSWRGLVDGRYWSDRILRLSFWGLNGGLFLMFSTVLLPIGLLQVWYSYDVGFWFARSAAFYELPFVQVLGNWRMVPDTIIIVLGALPLLWFLVKTFPRLRRTGEAPRDAGA